MFKLGIFIAFAGIVMMLWELRRILSVISQQLREVTLLVAEGRARQSSVKRRSGGPKLDRTPTQQGPRHSGTRGARQARGLRTKRVGGEYLDSDTEGGGLQQAGRPPKDV